MQILRVLAVCLTATTVYGLPSLNSEMRCSACQTIAKELDKALRIETPQMNVRLSGRMPGTGGRQREVKWKVSELRLIETFESLCQHRMEGYFLMGDKRWIKANSGKRNSALLKALTGGGSGNLDVGGAKSQEYRLALRYFCDALVEEHEETLSRAIRTEVVDGLGEYLCVKKAKVCTPEQYAANVADESDVAAELQDEIATEREKKEL